MSPWPVSPGTEACKTLLVKIKTKKAYCISAAVKLGVKGPGIAKMRVGRAKKSNFLDRDLI